MTNKIYVQEKLKDGAKTAPVNYKNIIEIINPALRVEKCVGVFRFRFVNNKLESPNVKMKIVSVIAAALFALTFSLVFDTASTDKGTEKIITLIQNVPEIFVVMEYIVITNITTFLLSKANIRIILKLVKIDQTLYLSNDKAFYVKSRRQTYIFLSYLILIYVINIIFSYTSWSDENSVVRRVLVVVVYFIQDLETLVFYNYITILNERLKIVNKHLNRAIKDGQKESLSIFTLTGKKDKQDPNIASLKKINLKDLASTYDQIGEICCYINSVFNISILMSLVTTFSFIVITIWTSLYYFKISGDIAHSLFMILVWSITDVVAIVIMCFVCCRLLTTREETKVLVNELIMNYDLPKGMRVQAKAFMALVDAWPLRIYVFNMFSVDITLLMKFISVSTTYLIIMIQISHFL